MTEQASLIRLAATTVLVRNSDQGLETLLLRRNAKLAFAGGAWVFPGGAIDEPEIEAADSEEKAARLATVREVEEECGLTVAPQDLVHLFNPKQGYMQNCNISPDRMLLNSPLTPDKYPEYIYNVSWDTNNPRGRRTIQLLSEDESITKEEAISYAMDVYDYMATTWQNELRQAVASVENSGKQDYDWKAAVQAILEWDGNFVPESTATPVYKFWRLKCGNQLDLTPLATGKPLDAATRRRMLLLLSDAIADLKETYGLWNPAWGDIHKVGRGGHLFPVGGAEFKSGNRDANFTETLFDVNSRPSKEDPKLHVAHNGSMAMMLMFFHKDGIESYTCTPWGQTTDPKSPHFMDQGEKLYSQRQMKPTWWNKQDLMPNVESTTILSVPEN